MDKINRIQIYGERCSGTNYLENLLKENLKDIALCRDFGHKHFFHKPGVQRADDCLFIVVYRNPFDWLRSLHRQPYHAAPELKNISFSEFIRRPWRCVWDEEADKTPEDSIYGKEMMFERNPHTGRHFQNVIRLRTGKIRNWKSLHRKTRHCHSIKYEDLREAPEAFIETIADDFGLATTDEFKNITGYRGFIDAYRPRTYAPIDSEDVRHIVRNLNMEIEASIGYEIESLIESKNLVRQS